MNFLSLLSKSIRLDIFDLNFVYGSDTLGKKRLSLPKRSGHPRGILLCIGSYLHHMMKSVKDIPSILKIPAAKGKVLFFVSSLNQKQSLIPIKEKSEESLLVGGSIKSHVDVDLKFPLFWAHLISGFFLPVLMFRFFKAKAHQRESFSYDLDSYWLTYGYFIIACLWINYLKPRVIIFSNDHSVAPRIVAYVAKNLRIPTVYIQHASVTDQFPPLRFDFAFLEGMDSLQKYEKIGNSNTTVFLIGMPKSDNYINFINRKQRADAFGICLNVRDRIDLAEELCKLLRNTYPELVIWIRPHPRDKRQHEWNRIANSYNLKLSNPLKVSSFDFLHDVDAIIAGNSNIILEAALMDVFPVGYELSGTNIDWYGFSEQVLVDYTSDPNYVIRRVGELITHKPSIRMKAKTYSATIGTRFDGHSTQLAAKLIWEISENGEIALTNWRLIDGISLKAYTL